MIDKKTIFGEMGADKTVITTMEFLKRKKYLFLVLGVMVLVYLFIKVLTFYAHSLIVLEFAFLVLVFGLAPAYFFRKVFRFENMAGWLVNSSVLGILIIPFLFIVFGWLGLNLVFTYSVPFLYSCALLGLVLLFVFTDDVSVRNYFNWGKTVYVDAVFYIILICYTGVLTLLNFHDVYFHWDTFTFWGLDAKYIFQLNHLRDSSADVFGSFRYTAYYPVYYSIIYDLYESVAEQYANWINVLLNFLALLLVYNNTLRKNVVQKSLVVTLLIFISYAAISAVYMFSMYADVLSAFNLLLFMVVLTTDYDLELKNYSKRMGLLLLSAISLYFIKSPFIFLTGLLSFFYILYDLKFLLSNYKALLIRSDIWLVIALIAVLYLMRSYYFTTVVQVGSNTPMSDLYLPRFTSLYSTLEYGVGMISWLFNKSPYLVGLWCLGVGSVFIAPKQLFNKNYYFIYWVLLIVVFSYCASYTINQTDLSSSSLLRYCAIVMYLIPLMLSYMQIEFSPIKSLVLMALCIIVSTYTFVKTMTPMPLYEPFALSTGSYNVVLKKEAKIAEKTLLISGDDARILIADDLTTGNIVSNMYMDAMFVRYLLMFNSVGGQYVIPVESLQEYALKHNADYILLLSYADTLSHCEEVFDTGHNYLISVNKDKFPDLDGCAFSGDQVVDLIR